METSTQPMIKASELRLGNWVKGNGYYKIEFIDHQTDGYEPIPLTPEILEKAGFKNTQHPYCNDHYHLKLKNRKKIEVWQNAKNEWVFSFSTAIVREPICTTLHQLQNLYFALTGSELEINL